MIQLAVYQSVLVVVSGLSVRWRCVGGTAVDSGAFSSGVEAAGDTPALCGAGAAALWWTRTRPVSVDGAGSAAGRVWSAVWPAVQCWVTQSQSAGRSEPAAVSNTSEHRVSGERPATTNTVALHHDISARPPSPTGNSHSHCSHTSAVYAQSVKSFRWLK